MHRPILTALFALAGTALAPAALAAIPQFNGTCPGGIEVHADDGGPVYINGRETRIKRFNDNYYEASDGQGLTLSINRTADGGTQMSYTGPGNANGVCSVGAAANGDRHEDRHSHARDDDRNAPSVVTCESVDQKQVECEMDTRGEVQVSRQLSRTRCERGRNWDLNRHSVWVKDGCRAEFRNVSASDRSSTRGAAASGSNLLGACDARARADGTEVTRVPVNDSVTELIVDYPDGRFLCMVGNDGQVQSLTPLRKRR